MIHGRPTSTVAQAYFAPCLTVYAKTQGAAGAVAPAAVEALEDPDDAAEWFMELLDDVLLRVDLAVDSARAALRVRAGTRCIRPWSVMTWRRTWASWSNISVCGAYPAWHDVLC